MRDHIKNLYEKYKGVFPIAKPFPHVVIDDFLPLELAKDLSDSISLKNAEEDNGWVVDSNKENNYKRFRLEDTNYMRSNLNKFASYLNSRDFVLFMEKLSENKSLIVDPYFIGGGAMITETGGFLNMHIDFNWHHKLQLWRKLNCIFYLTEDWDSSWGGELYLSESNKYEDNTKKVIPKFNRAIIFQTDGNSWHGHPIPLNCPPNIQRKVFSVFYYSTKKNVSHNNEAHFTQYGQNNNLCDGKEVENSPYCSNLDL